MNGRIVFRISKHDRYARAFRVGNDHEVKRIVGSVRIETVPDCIGKQSRNTVLSIFQFIDQLTRIDQRAEDDENCTNQETKLDVGGSWELPFSSVVGILFGKSARSFDALFRRAERIVLRTFSLGHSRVHALNQASNESGRSARKQGLMFSTSFYAKIF